jgi:preprotein translocase subunit SecG
MLPIILPIRFFFCLVVIAVVLNQGPAGEGLLQFVYEGGWFSSFRDAKYFLRIFTWTLFATFLFVQAVAVCAKGVFLG